MATKKSVASPVPDNWEDDDSDDEPEEERNRRIWEEANTKVAAPMPTIICSSASSVTPVPPPAALHPSLRILKRPSPSSSASPTPGESTTDVSTDLKQREERYQAARERIFGADNPTQTASNSTQSAGRIVREPRGPDEGQGQDKGGGFVQRRRDHKPTPSSAQSGKQ